MDLREHQGFRVGHWTGERSGCTAVVFDEPAVASGEVRGGAPAEREFELLDPSRANNGIDAVVLGGGSVFGLAAADGAVRYLAERGRGVRFGPATVPICPALGIFDLAEGAEPPTAESGYAAAANAARAVGDWGRVGAGRGATVGQWRGEFLPAGIGWSAVRFRDVVVEAVVVLNAFGEPLRDLPVTSDGVFEWPDGSLLPPVKGNTTIGVVSTNAALSKVECHLVAQGAHDGLARAVTPPHTRFDGDAFIAASTGGARTRPDTDVVRAMAVAAVERAIDSVEIG